ncbi:MAG TPA: hypothetical protein VJY15_23880 [Candidatus Acidoferrum sp.]|nr:hypothetical protein [Candidatus Acidoferrum sp.]
MKRCCLGLTVLAICLFVATTASAQMGMDLFKKPDIAKAFNPVVGKGAQYLSTTTSATPAKTSTMEMYIVGKESVEGKDGYWMEFVSTLEKNQSFIGKALFTRDDFQFHRMIMQMPGQGAMEMPFNPNGERRENMQNNMNEWHSVGTESVTVPAGTFSCEHWRNDKSNSDVWTSDKVTPFGMVKEVSPHGSMVLSKLITDAQDRITGPVTKFDPQQMMQQMQQQHQKP